jgi:hypothetical protein
VHDIRVVTGRKVLIVSKLDGVGSNPTQGLLPLHVSNFRISEQEMTCVHTRAHRHISTHTLMRTHVHV